jgi:hypothetical protein
MAQPALSQMAVLHLIVIFPYHQDNEFVAA